MEALKEVDIHTLIQGDFRNNLTLRPQPNTETSGVMALSAATPEENRARIQHSFDIIRFIVRERTRKDIGELTPAQTTTHVPPLILNGDTQQVIVMDQIAQEFAPFGIEIKILPCGYPGEVNTISHFIAMNNHVDYEPGQFYTFVTTDYHASRVSRTAAKQLRPDIGFELAPVSHLVYPYNVYRQVRGEVKRIKRYTEKGDISDSSIR